MAQQTTYYLGRVVKLGTLTADMVVRAILSPTAVQWWGNSWSFFDAQQHVTDGVSYVSAKLSKFNPEGEVIIADTKSRQEIVQSEPNLRIASSSFIYIPEVSGVAFTKVYNHIEEHHFAARFSDVVEQTHLGFFVECHVHLITDLRTFAQKLMSLDGIIKIAAVVHPPNPLFGPLWKELKEYIEKRRSEKMLVREEATIQIPLNTELPRHVALAADQTPQIPYVPKSPLPIGDAAILMAADGYGSGAVKGIKGNELVVIKTSETHKNFSTEEEASIEEAFRIAYAAFKQIEEDRHMEH
jgi:hypothetical protein